MTEAMTDRLTRITTQTSADDVLPKQPINKQSAAEPVKTPAADVQGNESDSPKAEGLNPILTAFSIEDAMNMPPVEWVVENFIAEQTITIVHSEPKVGKSNVFGNLAASIALGTEWLGMPTVKNPVLWIDLDMGHIGAMRRMLEITSGISDKIDNETFQNLHIITPETFRVSGLQRFDFFSHVSVTELELYIMTNKIKVCFIDTLSQIRGASNENDSGDMSRVFETIKTIRDITGCAFVIIHHSTKPSMYGRQTARGSSVIYAEPDLIVSLSKDDKDDNTLLTMNLESARYIEPRKIGLWQTWQPRLDEDGQTIIENGKMLKSYRLEARDLQEEKKHSTFEQYSKLLKYIRENPKCSFNQIADAKEETGIRNRNKLKALLEELTPDQVVTENGSRGAKLYSIAPSSE